jgi:hypothetical protein
MIIPLLTFRYTDRQGRVAEYNLLSGKQPLTTLSARRREVQDELNSLTDDDPDHEFLADFFGQLLEQIDTYVAARGDVTFRRIPADNEKNADQSAKAG